MFDRRLAGFTLVELLVVISIIGMVVGITLPAVQYARESARKVTCANNLRQFGIAMNNYASVYGAFPPCRTTSPQKGWSIELMPYLDADTFVDDWDLEKDYFDNANKRLLLRYIGLFHCPSTPDKYREVEAIYDSRGKGMNSVRGLVSDYYVHRGGIPMYDGKTYQNALEETRRVQASEFTDGLSCTILMNEQGGRPTLWREGKKTDSTVKEPWMSLWGGVPCTKIPNLTQLSRIVNYSNDAFYSFHPGMVQGLFVDGAVRRVSEKAIPYVVLALNTRDGGENVRADDLELVEWDESFLDPDTNQYPDGSSPE
ncbi:MAG: DUF1559 domain-containing protein [Planctomycetia bacterium]|nr:DUF1559 domain-containing protein [Planctomycetia bacterium]MDO5113458.1 DUF1559 domain-containing protein [Planctomycetia bacterium]